MNSNAVIIAVVVFLMLHVVRMGGGIKLWHFIAGFLLVTVILPFGLGRIVSKSNWWPGGIGFQVAESLREKTGEGVRQGKKLYLIIEGASHTAWGLDGQMLEQELVAKGYSIRVLQCSFAGASHFSRMAALNEVIFNLSPGQKQGVKEGFVILLREVHEPYDRHPLLTFAAEGEPSLQDIATMSPGIALQALKAGQATGSLKGKVKSVVQASVWHWFHVGVLGRKEFWETAKGNGGFERMEPGSPTEIAAHLEKYQTEANQKNMFSLPSWMVDFDRRLEKEVLGGLVDVVMFQAPPTLSHYYSDYEQAWATAYPQRIFFRGNDVGADLLRPGMWSDDAHLSGPGAEIYTRWLAARVAEELEKIPELKH